MSVQRVPGAGTRRPAARPRGLVLLVSAALAAALVAGVVGFGGLLNQPSIVVDVSPSPTTEATPNPTDDASIATPTVTPSPSIAATCPGFEAPLQPRFTNVRLPGKTTSPLGEPVVAGCAVWVPSGENGGGIHRIDLATGKVTNSISNPTPASLRTARSSVLPAGTRIQPSLTQYSSTSCRSLPLKRMPMSYSQIGRVVVRAARVDGEAVGQVAGRVGIGRGRSGRVVHPRIVSAPWPAATRKPMLLAVLSGVLASRRDAVAVAVRVVAQERAAAQRAALARRLETRSPRTTPRRCRTTLYRPKPLGSQGARRDRARLPARRRRVREVAVPDVAARHARRRRAARRPRDSACRQAAARGVLPLGLGRQPRAGPGAVGRASCQDTCTTGWSGRRGRASPGLRGAASRRPRPAATTAGRRDLADAARARAGGHLQVEHERSAEPLGVGDVAGGAHELGELARW